MSDKSMTVNSASNSTRIEHFDAKTANQIAVNHDKMSETLPNLLVEKRQGYAKDLVAFKVAAHHNSIIYYQKIVEYQNDEKKNKKEEEI